MNNESVIKNYINTMIDGCKSIDHDEIVAVYNALVGANDIGGKIYICGNGGSASTASHFQTDLNKAFSLVGNTMPAVCLADNISTLTATANDGSYEDVFRYQLQYLLRDNDILIVISGSGNSANVVKAAEYAKEKGNTVIAVVGFDGGKLKAIADCVFHVAIDNMKISEDLHLMFCHLVSTMIAESVERKND